MHLRTTVRFVLLCLGVAATTVVAQPAFAQAARSTRVVGVVRDEMNAIALPGIPVEVVDTKQVVYTDVDGRYLLELQPGAHEVRIVMEGYQPKTLKLDITGEASGRLPRTSG